MLLTYFEWYFLVTTRVIDVADLFRVVVEVQVEFFAHG